jgi:dCMP deaminase
LGGCLRDRLGVPSGERHEVSRAIHAEQNAIIQAATSGVNIQGATLYSTHHPCVLCTKMVINAGIKRIVVRKGYPDELSRQILKEAKLKVEMFKPEAK